MNISIITPWINHPELLHAYASAVQGAQVIIIDNNSTPDNAMLLETMANQLGNDSIYVRNHENVYFAAANEQGRALAERDILLFLNNDITASPGWLQRVEWDCGAMDCLAGPSTGVKAVLGQPLQYIEGWCIGGHRYVWDSIGGWDAETYKLPYWEDNDVCFRAMRRGFRLQRRTWSVKHLRPGTTTAEVPEAQQAIYTNAEIFRKQVIAAYERDNHARQSPGLTRDGLGDYDSAESVSTIS